MHTWQEFWQLLKWNKLPPKLVKPAQTAFCVRRSLQCPQNGSSNQMTRYRHKGDPKPEHLGGPKISKTWTLSPRSEQQDSSRSWTDRSIGCKSKLEGLLYTKYLFNEALHTRAGRWCTCTTLSLDDISSFCFQFLRKAYLHPPHWHLGNTALLYPCCSSFCALNRQELQKQRSAAIKVSREN